MPNINSYTPIPGLITTADILVGVRNGAMVNMTVGSLASQSGTFSGTSSGTNTGDQTIALSGDATGSGTGALTMVLATVNGNVGSFGSTTSIPNITVNAKGLITAAGSNVVIAPAGTLSGAVLNSTVVTSSLTAVGTIATGTWHGTVIAGTYGGTGVNNGSNTITCGGNINFGGSYSNTVTTVNSSSNATIINLATSNVFKHTFTEDTTFTFSNPTATGTQCKFHLWLFQGGTPHIPTWPGSVKWSNAGVVPVLNNANKDYIITFATIDGGTNWVGILAAEAYA